MRKLSINPRTLGLVIGTRVALAFGIGLLVADRIPSSRRRTIAFSLIGLGAATTVPLVRKVFGSRDGDRRRLHSEFAGRPDPEGAPM